MDKNLARRQWDAAEMPPSSFGKVWQYFKLLQLTNQKVNLYSRKTTSEDLWTAHIMDCTMAQPYFIDSPSILDLGTGGGLPGLVLAATCPESDVWLLDKSEKKMHYLRKMQAELFLPNVRFFIHPEDLPNNSLIHTVTSRAFGSLKHNIDLVKQCKLTPTQYILYKAKRETLTEELHELQLSEQDVSIIPLVVPDLNRERHLLIYRPQ